MSRKYIIFLFFALLCIKYNYAQYNGGYNDGYSHFSACTDLNGSTQSYTTSAINGNTNVCTYGYENFSVNITSGSANSLYWKVPDGYSIVSGQGTNNIYVYIGNSNGDISVEINNGCNVINLQKSLSIINCPMYNGGFNDGFDSYSNCTDLNGTPSTLIPDIISGTNTFCANNSENYSINLLSGTATYYEWTGPPGSLITSGQGTNSATILFGDQNGDITVKISDGCNTINAIPLFVTNNCILYNGGTNDGYASSFSCIDLNGNNSTLGDLTITGSNTFCEYYNESFYASLTSGVASNYYWTVPEGATIISGQGSSSINVQFGNIAGNISVIASNNCESKNFDFPVNLTNCYSYFGGDNDGFSSNSTCTDLNGISSALVLNSINGTSEFCTLGTETYTLTLSSGTAENFFWTVPAGSSIVSGQGSNSILVNFGNDEGDIICEASNSCYTVISDPYHVTPSNCTQYLGNSNDGFSNSNGCYNLNGVPQSITLNNINGPQNFCPYTTETFSISTSAGYANYYYWTVPDGAIILSGQGSNIINVYFGDNGGDIYVEASNNCTSVLSNILNITTGNCTMYAGGNNDGYAAYTNCSNLNGAINNLVLNPIIGSTSVCPYSTEFYSISNSSGFANTYYWTVPIDANIVSGQGTNQIVVQYGNNAGDINVEVSSGCETVNSTPLTVTINGGCLIYAGGNNDGYNSNASCSNLNGVINSLTISNISGNPNPCPYSTETYTVNTTSGYADNFYWTVPAGSSIVSGQWTNTIQVVFAENNGNINVIASNSCENIPSSDFAITLASCGVYLGGFNDGFSNYTNCTDLNGNPSSISLSAITGDNSPCNFSIIDYSVSITSGYASYLEWTVPTDALIISGQGTNNIKVRVGNTAGTINCTVNNGCNTSVSSFNYTPSQCPMYNGGYNDGFASYFNCTDLNGAGPGFSLNPIVGPTEFCANTTENYSISLSSGTATYYEWSVPTGSTIIAGQGTSTITVLFGDINGNISVIVTGTCGTLLSTPLNVTNNCLLYNGGNNDGFAYTSKCNTNLNNVSESITLSNIEGNSDFCNYSTETYIITALTGSPSYYKWTVPNDATIINGQGSNTIQVVLGTIGGNIYVEASNSCESVLSSSLTITPGSCQPYNGGNNDGFTYNSACSSLNGGAITALSISDINGNNNFCPYCTETYSFSILTGTAEHIVWNIPSGATIISGQSTNTISVTHGSSVGNISVTVYNQCESITNTLILNIGSCTMYAGGSNDGFTKGNACTDLNSTPYNFTLNEIQGYSQFCPYNVERYNITLVSGNANKYLWSVPSGSTILSGQGSNEILVIMGPNAGNVSVEVSNDCQTIIPAPLAISPMACLMYAGGSNDGFSKEIACSNLNGGASGSSLTLNPIIGSNQFCTNSTETYSVTLASGNATSYNWSVPSGSSIVSGQNSNTILVYLGSIAGNVSVEVKNSCETVNSTPLALTPVNCRMYMGGSTDGFANATSPTDIPLPVEFLDFYAYSLENKIKLVWITASEQNSDYFSIEKSNDANIFSEISTVKASGMSNSNINYSTFDYNPNKDEINYYRLKEFDLNGSYVFSNIISVDFINNSELSKDNKIAIFPNPVTNNQSTSIVGSGFDKNSICNIIISDIYGKTITIYNIETDNNGEIKFSTNNFKTLPYGIYFLTIKSNNKTETLKFIKQ